MASDKTSQGGRICGWSRPVIHTDPAVAGGEPCIDGAPVTAVAGRIAAGEPVADVAADYGITRRQALTACWWCGIALEDFADWWARWADEAALILGSAPDWDTMCVPLADPPLIADDDEPVRPVGDVPTGGLL